MSALLPREPEALDRYLDIVRTEPDHRAGELAVRRGLLRQEDLDACLHAQAADPVWRDLPIGRVLVARGHLKPDELDWLLREQERAEFVDSLRPTEGPPEGERTIGRFVLVRKLGEGSMGEVWRAWDPRLERWVALKLLKGGEFEELRERFLREARSAARLRHPHIVPVYECAIEGDQPFIAMEYVDGSPASGRGRSVREVLEIAAAVADALACAHKEGIIHRDVKPGNILVDRSGKAFLADFGLARELEPAAKMTRTGAMLGTPAYMSPEQASGNPREIDALTDVYALGATLYEFLTGRTPFKGTSLMEIVSSILSDEPAPPSKIRRDIHPDVETICLKAMEKSKALRYGSASEMAADIRRFLDGAPILARRAPLRRRAARWIRRHPVLDAAGAAVLLLCVPLGILAWRARRDARIEREAKVAEENRRLAFMRASRELAPARAEIDTLDLMLARVPMTAAEIAPFRRRAEEAIGRALAAHPGFFEAHLERARLLETLGDREGARGALDAACRLAPDSPRPFAERAKFTLRGLFQDPAVVLQTLIGVDLGTSREAPVLPLDAVLDDIRAARRIAPLSSTDEILVEVLQADRAQDRRRLKSRLESAKAEGLDFGELRMIGLACGAAGDLETMAEILEPVAELRPRDALVRLTRGWGRIFQACRLDDEGNVRGEADGYRSALADFEAVLSLSGHPGSGPIAVCARRFSLDALVGIARAAIRLGEDPLPAYRKAVEVIEKLGPEEREHPTCTLSESFVREEIGRSPAVPLEERLDMLAAANRCADRVHLSPPMLNVKWVARRFQLFSATAQLARSGGREELVTYCFRAAEEYESALPEHLSEHPTVLLVRANLYRNHCLLFQDHRSLSRAESLVEKAFPRIPPNDEQNLERAYRMRVQIRYLQGRYREALEDCARVRTRDPKMIEWWKKTVEELKRLIAARKER